MKIKKFAKEIVIIALAVFVITNVIGYIRGTSVKSSGLSLLMQQETINGKKVKDIVDSKKVLIVNFWGSWCPICMKELGTIQELSKRDDITLITVANNSGDNEKLKEFMKSKNLTYIVVNDNNGKISESFKIDTFPTNIFYSKDRNSSIADSGYISTMGFGLRIKMADRK